MELNDKDYTLFVDFWRNLPRDSGNILPYRLAVNPSLIKRLLPYLFIFRAKAEMVLEVRLSGTALDTLSEQPMTGRNYLDLCPESEKALYWHTLRLIREQPCGLMIVRDVMFPGGKINRLKSINFPMLDSDGLPTFVLGVTGSMRPSEMVHTNPSADRVSSALLKMEVINIGAGAPEILASGVDGIKGRLGSLS
jgi:hypothetical protein